MSRPISPEALKQSLRAYPFFSNIVYRHTCDSTNNIAKRLAEKGLQEGTVIVAENQTAGKGRKDRKWLSVPYKNLLFSVILRPKIDIKRAFLVTVVSSVALIRAIEDFASVKAEIKWPNDIYVNYRKLAGILTEFSTKGRALEYVVVGIGLNVNWNPPEDAAVRNPCTSLKTEIGVEIDREILLSEILKSLWKHYKILMDGNGKKVFHIWKEKNLVFGRKIEADLGTKKLEGFVKDIDDTGHLILEGLNGSTHTIGWGDVSIKF